MKSLRPSHLTVLCVLSVAFPVSAAETGDFDGDGRLTIRDTLRILDTWADPNLELAAGSFAAFAAYPPTATLPDNFLKNIAGNVYLESVRRALSGPYPTCRVGF